MIFVDAHVHIYDCFDLKSFLDSALANFKAEAARCQQMDAFTAVLLLTETSSDKWFQRLASYAREGTSIGSNRYENWTFHPTTETYSLWARRAGPQGLYVIAGRQIVTAEDLEVLALITDEQFEDRHPLQKVIQAVTETGAIPVIPWGFGKWTGLRGKIVKNAIEASKSHTLFLGDNSGRARFLPRPFHFKLAESKGIRILAGSDPLPFASEYQRSGSFGFSLQGSINQGQPGQDIKRILLDPGSHLRAYGSLEKPYRFFRNQLAMQIKKRLPKWTRQMS